jgi:hypothetical protein
VKESRHDDTPVLITQAAPSFDDQHAARKRKYMIMMGMRIPCLILAACFVSTPWLALTFVAISIPLPWVAVLIANDRPPRKAQEFTTYQHQPERPAIGPSAEHPVIEQ